MTSSNNESELSLAPINPSNPFNIAARSAVPFRPANHTRNASTRREITSPKRPKKRRTTQAPTLQTTDDHIALATVPINVLETSDQEGEPLEDSFNYKDLTLQSYTLAPESSVSQASEVLKFTRSKTFEIYQHVTVRNSRFYYNYCFKSYLISGGIANMTRYLKNQYSIDLAISITT